MKETISIILNVILVACALIVTGLVIRREFFSPKGSSSLSQRIRKIENWKAIAATGYFRGLQDAPVKVIVFSDYQCAFCREIQPTLKYISEKYSNAVTIIYRHFPLANHPHAYKAALAVECAAKQDRFEQYHNLLFDNQELLGDTSWNALARAVKIPDINAFNGCLAQKRTAAIVDTDLRTAQTLQINSIPTLLVNETMISGALSIQELDNLVQQKLQK
jgi:protein-disulfide isomerase